MKRVIPILFFLVSSSVFAQQRQFTLQQCIDTAIRNNINVRSTALDAERAAIDYNQSKYNLLPNVNGFVSHGINKGRSIDPFTNSFVNQSINFANYGLSASVPLFNGFSLRNTIKQLAYAHDAARMQLQQAKDELTLNVIIAYLQVLNNEDMLEVAKQQVAVSQKQVERLQVLNRQGAINPPQLHELQGQLKDNELAVLNSANALETAKLQLAQLMNIPYDKGIRLERYNEANLVVPPDQTADAILQKALNSLAAVKAIELRKKSAESAIKASKGALFPTLFFNGNINTNYSSIATRDVLQATTEVPTSNYVVVNGNQFPVIAKRDQYTIQKIGYGNQLESNLFSNVALTLRVPVFNSFQTRNRIKLAQIEWKNTQLVAENVTVQLRQQVEQAHLNLVNAWSRFQLLTEQVSFFKEAFRAAEVRFDAGVGNSVDYVIAKNNYDRANLNLVMAKYDYLLRRQVVNFYSGDERQ
jgi:outer membrane protein